MPPGFPLLHRRQILMPFMMVRWSATWQKSWQFRERERVNSQQLLMQSWTFWDSETSVSLNINCLVRWYKHQHLHFESCSSCFGNIFAAKEMAIWIALLFEYGSGMCLLMTRTRQVFAFCFQWETTMHECMCMWSIYCFGWKATWWKLNTLHLIGKGLVFGRIENRGRRGKTGLLHFTWPYHTLNTRQDSLYPLRYWWPNVYEIRLSCQMRHTADGRNPANRLGCKTYK